MMATLQRILVPTDFSEVTRDTLERARKLAAPSRAELHVLHTAPSAGPTLPGGDEADRRSQSLRERLDHLAQPAALDGLPIVCVTRSGKPWAEIVAYAREAQIDLIVMGTHGRTGLVHAVMGSVTEQVIRHAPCPVLVVRPDGEADELEPQPGNGRAESEASTPLTVEPDAEAQIHATAERARLDAALRLLRGSFGDTLEGERHETWDRMIYVLCRDLDQEPPEAGRLLSDLESARAIVWRGGYEADEDEDEESPHWAFDDEVPEPASRVTEFTVLDQDEPIPSASIDLLQRALVSRATDIHIDPTFEGQYQVRFRIDGRLESYCELDAAVATPLMQQFKVMASLDIAEPFEPKEGRLTMPASLADVEVRLTTAPVQGGSAMALRLLQSGRIVMPLKELGLLLHARDAIDAMLRHGDGLVLVTGPTNAGKTTTIYSLLGHVSSGDRSRNLVSIEDPVEFPLPFLRQVAVDPRHNLDMARGLRTILRMDPDVVFVSEIRDIDAAEIAMRAASSGRFVFATMHTRDAASIVTALRDLHVDNRSMGGNLTGLISQRLLRRLCPRCAVRSPINPEEARQFHDEGIEPPDELAHPVGCPHCRNTGYFDRIGIFEAVVTNGDVGEAISSGATEEDLRQAIRRANTPSLTADALMKAREGLTSLEEAHNMKWA